MPEPEPKMPGRPVHDPKVLRAISHPTRNRILNELSASGPMRAADVARELDIPANQASFHLRQLAKYGLVEEDSEAGRDRRDRVWRPVGEEGLSIDLAQLAAQPGGEAAARFYQKTAASWGHHVVDRAHSADRDEGVVVSTSEHAIKLTRDEARAMQLELLDVLSSWSERTRGRDAHRRTYLAYLMVLPYPELPAATEADD